MRVKIISKTSTAFTLFKAALICNLPYAVRLPVEDIFVEIEINNLTPLAYLHD